MKLRFYRGVLQKWNCIDKSQNEMHKICIYLIILFVVHIRSDKFNPLYARYTAGIQCQIHLPTFILICTNKMLLFVTLEKIDKINYHDLKNVLNVNQNKKYVVHIIVHWESKRGYIIWLCSEIEVTQFDTIIIKLIHNKTFRK